MSSEAKGNNPELWNKLLEALDEKLQMALLDKVRRITSYHFEDGVLYVEAGTADDEEYLKKSSTFQQLQLFAQDATKVREVRIKPRSS